MPVVVGTTLSPADAALGEVAAGLASAWSTSLRVVHVCEDLRAPFVLGTDEEGMLGPVRARLDAEVRRLGVGGGAHLAAGDVAHALTTVASFDLADLLLVGAGPTGGARLGRTAERVARASAVPVLVAREGERLLAWLRGERPLRILVGADAGRAATAARRFAARLATLGPCEVEVEWVADAREVHARLGLPAPADAAHLAPEAAAALRRELDRAAPPEERASCLVVAARTSADVQLATRAEQGDFDLVVVGQRRQSLLEQLWYGSVALGMLRASPVSVACVPPELAPPRPAFRPPRVVLVGVDLGPTGEAAAAQGAGLVAEGGELHLAHVRPTGAPATTAAAEPAWQALNRLAAELPVRPARIERHVLQGETADQLLGLAERVGADLLVLGAPPRAPGERALLGSVNRAIAERADIPVLLVPPGRS